MHPIAVVALILVLTRWVAQLALEAVNRAHVRAHAGEVPAAWRDSLSREEYAKSVDYTLAKSRFAAVEGTWSTLLLVVALFSGILPWFWTTWTGLAGDSIWAGAGGLALIAVALSIPGLPLEWWAQFRLEERFGFNTTTLGTWVADHLKGAALGAVLGVPLLALLLWLFRTAGDSWWLWGWGAMVGIQLVLLVLAPILILPLFNKFTPLPEGSLRERLMGLAHRTGFHARSIEVMDGSKRSRHANAFFTGLGKFRKIVLFDTLLNQLDEQEVEAVLAHEIGHYQRGHIPKLLAGSMLFTLVGFATMAWLARQPEWYAAFGFSAPAIPIAFLLFALLADTVTFWTGPLTSALSRRFEYQADAYAAAALQTPLPLVQALRKLHHKNLSNLTPHPWYSRFHYSHPTLLERETALGLNP